MFTKMGCCIAVAISFCGVADCANNQQTAASASTPSSTKTYTSDDLQRTGKRDAGQALRSADPSVTATER